MHFTYGCTRWVILTNRYAVKIARFRPIRPFIRLWELLQEKQVRKNLEKHHSNPLLGAVKYLAAGIVANRREYLLYKKHGNDLLAPTLFTICWLVNIQQRGEPIRDNEVRSHYLWSLFEGEVTTLATDILQRKQFCLIDGQVRLADYGIDGLEPVIVKYNAAILNK